MRPAELNRDRIVSLVPCITDSLLELDCADRIAGITRYCPAVPGAKVVGGIWDLDRDMIRSLSPDLVLVDPEENRPEDIEYLESALRVQRVQARTVEDSFKVMLSLKSLSASLYEPSLTRGRRPGTDIEVVVPIWLEPLRFVGSGTYAADLLSNAGLVNRVEESGYPAIGEEGVIGCAERLKDAWVLRPTEPHKFGAEDVRQLSAMYPLARGFRVVDGRDLFWYGARTAEALDRLIELHAGLSREEP